jgi:hypothetical protein
MLMMNRYATLCYSTSSLDLLLSQKKSGSSVSSMHTKTHSQTHKRRRTSVDRQVLNILDLIKLPQTLLDDIYSPVQVLLGNN